METLEGSRGVFIAAKVPLKNHDERWEQFAPFKKGATGNFPQIWSVTQLKRFDKTAPSPKTWTEQLLQKLSASLTIADLSLADVTLLLREMSPTRR